METLHSVQLVIFSHIVTHVISRPGAMLYNQRQTLREKITLGPWLRMLGEKLVADSGGPELSCDCNPILSQYWLPIAGRYKTSDTW